MLLLYMTAFFEHRWYSKSSPTVQRTIRFSSFNMIHLVVLSKYFILHNTKFGPEMSYYRGVFKRMAYLNENCPFVYIEDA